MSQPEQIVIQCPACGGRLRAPREAIGSQVGCPTCQAAITVRDPAAAAGPTPLIVDSSRNLGAPTRGEAAVKSDFNKDRLRTTSESTFQVDPDNPVMKRRDWRKQKHGDTLTEWDATAPRQPVREGRARRFFVFLTGASGLLALTLAGIFMWRIQESPAAGTTNTANLPRSLELRPVGDFRDEVWSVVEQFCSAPTAEALLPFVREPERVAPFIKKFYHAENPWRPLALATRPDLSDLAVHRDFVVMHLPLADYSTRPIGLEQTPEGFRVDWESFVGYSELTWEELMRTRPREPVLMRAVIRPSDYYNKDYASADTHRCYQISDLKGDHVIYGYVLKESAIEIKIVKTMLHARELNVVLRVRYPDHSTNDRQVEITEIVEKGWIFREDDIPETIPGETPGDAADPVDSPAPEASPAKPAVLPGLTQP